MKAIKAAALILWMFIFVIIAFLAGQYLSQKGIFNMFDGERDEEQDKQTIGDIEEVKNTEISVNKQYMESYFGKYCEEFVKYLVSEDKDVPEEKTEVPEEYVESYVFYAIRNYIDEDEYKVDNLAKDEISILESEVNRFANKKFAKELSQTVKENSEYGYNKDEKKYTLKPQDRAANVSCTVIDIENTITGEIVVTYSSKKLEKILIYLEYNKGNYSITSIEKK